MRQVSTATLLFALNAGAPQGTEAEVPSSTDASKDLALARLSDEHLRVINNRWSDIVVGYDNGLGDGGASAMGGVIFEFGRATR